MAVALSEVFKYDEVLTGRRRRCRHSFDQRPDTNAVTRLYGDSLPIEEQFRTARFQEAAQF